MGFRFGSEENRRRVTKEDILNGAPISAGEVYEKTMTPVRQGELERAERHGRLRAEESERYGNTIAGAIGSVADKTMGAYEKAEERGIRKQAHEADLKAKAAQTKGQEVANDISQTYGKETAEANLDSVRAGSEGTRKNIELADTQVQKSKREEAEATALASNMGLPDAAPNETFSAWKSRKNAEILDAQGKEQTNRVALLTKELKYADRKMLAEIGNQNAQGRAAAVTANQMERDEKVKNVAASLRAVSLTGDMGELKSVLQVAHKYGVPADVVADAIDQNQGSHQSKVNAALLAKQLDPDWGAQQQDRIESRRQIMESDKLLTQLENQSKEYKKENTAAWFDTPTQKATIANMQSTLRSMGKDAQAEALGKIYDVSSFSDRQKMMDNAIMQIKQDLAADVEVNGDYLGNSPQLEKFRAKYNPTKQTRAKFLQTGSMGQPGQMQAPQVPGVPNFQQPPQQAPQGGYPQFQPINAPGQGFTPVPVRPLPGMILQQNSVQVPQKTKRG